MIKDGKGWLRMVEDVQGGLRMAKMAKVYKGW
jgi:hypothetical protein